MIKLPEFVEKELSNPNIKEHLLNLAEQAKALGYSLEKINDVLESKIQKNPETEEKLIVLGFEITELGEKIKKELEENKNITFEQYFNVIQKLFEKIEILVTVNKTNLYKTSLRNHIKDTLRKAIIDSMAVEIINTYFLHIYGPDDELS